MQESRERLERILNQPRYVGLHIAVFTVAMLLLGFYAIVTPPGIMERFVSGAGLLTILVWSVLLPIHAVWALWRSGLWGGARDKAVREEVLQVAEDQDLSAEEAIEAHKRLSRSLRNHSWHYALLLLAALGHTAVWFGGVALTIFDELFFNTRFLSYEYEVFPLSAFASALLSVFLVVLLGLYQRWRAGGSIEEYYHGALKRKRAETSSQFTNAEEVDTDVDPAALQDDLRARKRY
jgi:hypothetical protein